MGRQQRIVQKKRDPDQGFGVVFWCLSSREVLDLSLKEILLNPSASYLQKHKLSAAATLPTN
jgi:hypothetical protein